MSKLLVIAFVLLCSACSRMPAVEAQPLAPVQGASAVLFDIDGTLTLSRNRVFTVQPQAAAAVQAFAAKGYEIIYLSHRVRWMKWQIPGWMKKHHFPQGPVLLRQSSADDDPVEFKTRSINALKQAGYAIAFAYGDSSTDFEAYANAGIPSENVIALRRQGEDDCLPGLYSRCLSDGWGEYLQDTVAHLPAVNAEPL